MKIMSYKEFSILSGKSLEFVRKITSRAEFAKFRQKVKIFKPSKNGFLYPVFVNGLDVSGEFIKKWKKFTGLRQKGLENDKIC